jgi:diazepam-binding inhibitor (GABA receptor modulating acyl-CoA-binding protein)
MASLRERFETAVRESKQLPSKPDNEALLELYSYFKQATDGDVTGARPGPFDFVARAKHDAWEGRRGMSKEVAMNGYIKLVAHLKLQK